MTGLADLSVPGPTVTALTEPFWRAASEGRLLIQRCGGCRSAIFYPREICPHCWSADLHWEAASGRGSLKSFAIVRKPGHPGWIAATPYAVGLVTLDEGPTMLSHIVTDGRPAAVGRWVMVRFTNIGGRILPAFVLIPEEDLT